MTKIENIVNQAVQQAVAALLAKQALATPQASTKPADSSRKAKYEAQVLRGMRKKLGKDADIQLRVNVLTFKDWVLKHGRVVRKGESSVKGCFHISQTDVADAETIAKFQAQFAKAAA